MTLEELRERQSWSLDQKIDHSLGVIEQFYTRLNGNVYISFSGGKDSTVLLWLARKIYPNIKAVFCNTGNEYPDIVRFVRNMKECGENIEIIYPKIKPKDVFKEFGFPLIGKEKANQVWMCRNRPNTKKAIDTLNSESRFKKLPMCYRYMLKEPYEISDACCKVLKKQPMREYELKYGLSPIIGTLADESKTREQAYIRRGGCNVFNKRDTRKQNSLPLSIWTNHDIWECIDKYNIPIADIYHKGLQRTGCMFCMFGAQFKDDTRLETLYKLYPKWYQTFMDYENNGVTYREAARKFLQTHGLCLPDEKPLSLFDV